MNIIYLYSYLVIINFYYIILDGIAKLNESALGPVRGEVHGIGTQRGVREVGPVAPGGTRQAVLVEPAGNRRNSSFLRIF